MCRGLEMPFIADNIESALLRPSETHDALPSPKKGCKMCVHDQDVVGSLAVGLVQDKACTTHLENVVTTEKENGQVEMEGLEYTSRPPSPPLSGASTPRLNIGPCPVRLAPTIPPPNYGVVQRGMVFRSAFPQDRNMEFLKGLHVKTILCLVDTQPGTAYDIWVQNDAISRRRVDIAANKDGKIKTTWDSLCEALLIMMDAANYPLYIHCNQGRHRTGCVVACLRKVQRWPMADIITEYETYSNPKMRSADKDLVQSFDLEAVFEYAQKHGRFADRPFMRRMDSVIVDTDSLARALSIDDECQADVLLGMDASTISGSSYAEGDEDEGLSMLPSTIPGTSEEEVLAAQGTVVVADPAMDDQASSTGIPEIIIGQAVCEDDVVMHVEHDEVADATVKVFELREDDISPG